jgi:hypothetical protein
MAKNLLLVAHGVGVHEAGWEAAVQTKLTEVAGRYAAFQPDPEKLWDEVELQAVSYDGILSETLEQWKTHAGGVMDFVAKHKAPGTESLAWIEELAEQDEDYLWTHVGDVVIYHFFPLFRERIRSRVMRSIADAVFAEPGRHMRDCTILAHSLGTSVVHDSLHVLGTETIAGFANTLGPPNERFRAIVMLANVSRLLESTVGAFKSIVRGGAQDDLASDCTRFMSFRHELDPICVVRPFLPMDFDPQFNRIRSLSHYRAFDIHGYEHYLDHPRVHVPLLNSACGVDRITPDERDAAVDAYAKFDGVFSAVPQIQTKVHELKAELARLGTATDFGTIFEVASNVRRIVEEIRQILSTAHIDLDL